jgi:hypothetical protein
MVIEFNETNKPPMREVVSIKRSGSDACIDDLFGYSAGDVENEGGIEVVKSANFKLAEIEYDKYRKKKKYNKSSYNSGIVLLPDEINSFLFSPMIQKYASDDDYLAIIFIRQLIQNSYNHGHNNFVFKNSPYIDLCFSSLHGSIDRPLEISFNTNGTDPIFFQSSYVNARICGNVRRSFVNTHHLNIILEGNIGFHSGYDSKNCSIYVNGDIDYDFGKDSENIKLYVNGNVGNSFASSSTGLVAWISGSGGLGFGYNSNVVAYVGGKIESVPLRDLKRKMIFHNAKSHPKYKQMMKEWEDVFQ